MCFYLLSSTFPLALELATGEISGLGQQKGVSSRLASRDLKSLKRLFWRSKRTATAVTRQHGPFFACFLVRVWVLLEPFFSVLRLIFRFASPIIKDAEMQSQKSKTCHFLFFQGRGENLVEIFPNIYTKI